jgi:hypothetical protein
MEDSGLDAKDKNRAQNPSGVLDRFMTIFTSVIQMPVRKAGRFFGDRYSTLLKTS